MRTVFTSASSTSSSHSSSCHCTRKCVLSDTVWWWKPAGPAAGPDTAAGRASTLPRLPCTSTWLPTGGTRAPASSKDHSEISFTRPFTTMAISETATEGQQAARQAARQGGLGGPEPGPPLSFALLWGAGEKGGGGG